MSNQQFTDTDTAMSVYEKIINSVENNESDISALIAELKNIDESGQFLASTARFLAATDRTGYSSYINELVAEAINRDRERRYIGSLLSALWGEDYEQRADELREKDDNFRRIYKRIHPTGI